MADFFLFGLKNVSPQNLGKSCEKGRTIELQQQNYNEGSITQVFHAIIFYQFVFKQGA